MTGSIGHPTPAEGTAPLLAVSGLTVSYASRREPSGRREVVHGVDLRLDRGETLALVGESGSGKSTIAQALIGLLPAGGRVDEGAIELHVGGGAPLDLARLPDRALRTVRGRRIALIPQDPTTSLNPVRTIGDSVASGLLIHHAATRRSARPRILELLERVGLDHPERRARQYPHELSGGMRQRALIAAAIALDPEVIVADEPTSALDVTVQRRILDLIDGLRAELGSAVLLITHDLALAAERSDRVAVLHGGRRQEEGAASEVLAHPASDYARTLVADAPALAAAPHRPTPIGAPDFLTVSHLAHDYPARGQVFRAVDDVSFTIAKGTTHALVGESGSGKTTIGRAVAGFHSPTSGRITIGDATVFASDGSSDRTHTRHHGQEQRALRRQVQLVYQNPYTSLDPRRTVGATIAEPLRNSGVRDKARLRAAVAEYLDHVALPQDVAERLPRELSGGQRQRVAIARALIIRPELVVLDEAVSALDVTVQAQILALLDRLQRDLGLTYLFITHNLAVVGRIADTMTVLRRGKSVESGSARDILAAPQAEYTRELLAAVPHPSWSPRAGRGGPAAAQDADTERTDSQQIRRIS